MSWLDAACWSSVVLLVLNLAGRACRRENAKHFHSVGRMWDRISWYAFCAEVAATAVWLFCAANALTRLGE